MLTAETHARRARDFTRRWFLLAFGSVVVLFLGSAAFVRHESANIDAAAANIANNAGPSIAVLSSARAGLGDVLLRADEYVDAVAAGRPAESDRIGQAQRRVVADVHEYHSHAPFPGERDLWPQMSRDLARIDALVDELLIAVQRRQLERARIIVTQPLHDAVDSGQASLSRALDFNAAHVRSSAAEIQRMRHQVRTTSIVLDAASLMLAMIAGLIALRVMRRHTALLEEHRRTADLRAEEQGQFAARVAHDIRSPLTTVGLTLQLLARDTAGNPRAESALQRGRRALDRVVRIVEGLLDFARAGGAPQSGAHTDVGGVVDDLLGELQPEADELGVELRVEPYRPIEVACSSGVLTSVLANLLRNAIKYIVDRPVRRIVVRIEDSTPFAHVEVEDTGPGLPPELHGRVFEPYVRATGVTQPGLGIGLATVKRLCEMHGGAVGERPAPHGGTIFWFELPVAAATPVGAG